LRRPRVGAEWLARLFQRGPDDRRRAVVPPVEVLNAIYEEDFLGFLYGFRPGRGPHGTLNALVVGIKQEKVNCVVAADLRDCLTRLDHGLLGKLRERGIADRRVLLLISKWVKAGVIEDGKWSATEVGSPRSSCRRRASSSRRSRRPDRAAWT
jgi:hypothetical protein